jgi:ribonuclease BN (tRNA processing enzyme)
MSLRHRTRFVALAAFLATFFLCTSASAQQPAVDQVKGSLSVMVLGSGGPAAGLPGRASAGYLIFTDGKPRILMDAGGGTFKSLGASGTNIKALPLVLLSHLHIDHTADLSAMIKTIYFHNRAAGAFRTKPIVIYGPGANGKPFPHTHIAQYPSTIDYLKGHYDLPNGTERYLHIFAKAINGGIFAYKGHDISPDPKKPVRTIYRKDGLVIKAVGVIHGPVPALAYRIEYKGKSIVYSGDTSSKTNNMIKLAKGADLLIYDTSIMDHLPNGPKDGVFYKLHTTPSRMGQVAAAAKPKHLVLSHITGFTGPRLDKVMALIRAQGYKGRLDAAQDLKVYNLGD